MHIVDHELEIVSVNVVVEAPQGSNRGPLFSYSDRVFRSSPLNHSLQFFRNEVISPSDMNPVRRRSSQDARGTPLTVRPSTCSCRSFTDQIETAPLLSQTSTLHAVLYRAALDQDETKRETNHRFRAN